MVFLDPAGATKFLSVLAESEKIRVIYEAGLKVPYATPDGSIHVSTPKLSNLDDWLFDIHHEVSHAFPAHKYHFDAMKLCKKKYGELGGLICNLVVDNLAERYQYDRYEGRRMILSKGRFESIKEKSEKLFPDEETMGIIHGVLAWDCRQRTSWMGYPFEQFLSPVDKYPEVVKHCDDIELEKMMELQSTAEHILELVGKILEASASEDKSEDKSEGEGEDKSEGDSSSGSDPSGPADGDSDGSDPTGPADGDSDGSDPTGSGESEKPLVDNQRPDEGGGSLNVSEETKRTMAEFLMEPEEHSYDDSCVYQPEGLVTWLPLEDRPDHFFKNDIEKLSGGSKLTKGIQRHLQAMQQTSYDYGQKAGRLANRSLWKAGSGSTSIFRQKTANRIQQDTAVCILCDCSASMHNLTYGSDIEKITMAFASVAITADTLYNMRVPFEILGFTDIPEERKDVVISVPAMIEFKSYKENLNRDKVTIRLASVPPLRNNLDGEAVLESAHRLMQRKEGNKILLVLSDGNPVGHFKNGKQPAHDYLKEICQHIESETPIDLLAIGICDENVKKFYSNYQVINDVSDLDSTMMTLLKDRLIK